MSGTQLLVPNSVCSCQNNVLPLESKNQHRIFNEVPIEDMGPEEWLLKGDEYIQAQEMKL